MGAIEVINTKWKPLHFGGIFARDIATGGGKVWAIDRSSSIH